MLYSPLSRPKPMLQRQQGSKKRGLQKSSELLKRRLQRSELVLNKKKLIELQRKNKLRPCAFSKNSSELQKKKQLPSLQKLQNKKE